MKEDNTCYIERTKVREILITSNANNDTTRELLAEVDALPIFVASDFAAVAQEAQQPRVSLLDDELLIEWGDPSVVISIDDDGFGYAIRRGNQFEPGVSSKWSGAVSEIRKALAVPSADREAGK